MSVPTYTCPVLISTYKKSVDLLLDNISQHFRLTNFKPNPLSVNEYSRRETAFILLCVRLRLFFYDERPNTTKQTFSNTKLCILLTQRDL